jgi:hypothetical protein
MGHSMPDLRGEPGNEQTGLLLPGFVDVADDEAVESVGVPHVHRVADDLVSGRQNISNDPGGIGTEDLRK